MTRDEMFASVKAAVLADFEEWTEAVDDESYSEPRVQLVREATNLSELAEACRKSAWDLPSFTYFVLANSGWDRADLSWPDPYEWDT